MGPVVLVLRRNQPFFLLLQTLGPVIPWKGTGIPAGSWREEISSLFRALHCGMFWEWLGCSPAQAGRIWNTVADEIEPVSLAGKERFILTEDRSCSFRRRNRKGNCICSGHDPLSGLAGPPGDPGGPDAAKTDMADGFNPGAVLWHGEITRGCGRARKKGKGWMWKSLYGTGWTDKKRE